ncbi:MAG: endonuclease [Magnetococcales bacterium]|nr:endonuclease [Magnetococcales bacterium]
MTPFDLYQILLTVHGPRHWWPAKEAFEMMVGAILVQNTAWTQACKAVQLVASAGLLHPAAIRQVPDATLWELIRPAGYFRVKTRRLKALAEFLACFGDEPASLFALETGPLREKLLQVHGIGKETADSILCYEAKRPFFIVDTYTKRLFSRLGWVAPQAEYDLIQGMVHAAFPADPQALGEFHALIVAHAQSHCRKKPVCVGCPVPGCPCNPLAPLQKKGPP